MSNFIKDGAVTTTDYSLEDGDSSAAKEILPLQRYLELEDKSGDVGVWLDADEEIESIEACLANLPVVALNFPAFSDGRGYSSANILRRKYGYQGEIRAIGDVRIDQLEQMIRCGFDAFELAENQDAELALCRLNGFSVSYQQTVDREPLFKLRN